MYFPALVTPDFVLDALPLPIGAAVAAEVLTSARDDSAIAVNMTVPNSAGPAVLQPFVSFSIEFALFPDFADIFMGIVGPFTHPNDYICVHKSFGIRVALGNFSRPNKFSN